MGTNWTYWTMLSNFLPSVPKSTPYLLLHSSHMKQGSSYQFVHHIWSGGEDISNLFLRPYSLVNDIVWEGNAWTGSTFKALPFFLVNIAKALGSNGTKECLSTLKCKNKKAPLRLTSKRLCSWWLILQLKCALFYIVVCSWHFITQIQN